MSSRMVQDFSAVFGSTVAFRGATALFLVAASRALTVGEYGVLSFGIGAGLFAGGVADLGLQTLFSREIPITVEGPARRRLAASGLVAQLVLSGIASLLVAVLVPMLRDVPIPVASLSAVIAWSTSMAGPFRGVLRGTLNFQAEAALSGILAAMLVLGAAALAMSDTGVLMPLSVFGGAQVLWDLGAAGLAYQALSGIARPSVLSVVSLSRDCLHLTLIATVSQVAVTGSLVVFGMYASDAQLGHYSLAFQVFLASSIIGTTAVSVTMPRLAAASGVSEFRDRSRRLLWFLGGAGLVLGALIYVTTPTIVPLVFGSQFEPTIDVMRVFSAAVPFVLIQQGIGTALMARRSERVVLASMVVTALVAVATYVPVAATTDPVKMAAVAAGVVVIPGTVIQGWKLRVSLERWRLREATQGRQPADLGPG